MDRLHAVIASCLLFTVGCDDTGRANAPVSKSRVNAVVAKVVDVEKPSDFCDVYHPDATTAVTFSYPELLGDAPVSAPGWRWINMWATWCKPCIEEMPRLASWENELESKGLSDVVFVSADETEELVKKFREEHPEAPASAQLSSPDVMEPWLKELGLAGQASLPVHIFVDPAGKARCLRMGGVNDSDRAAVEHLLGG